MTYAQWKSAAGDGKYQMVEKCQHVRKIRSRLWSSDRCQARAWKDGGRGPQIPGQALWGYSLEATAQVPTLQLTLDYYLCLSLIPRLFITPFQVGIDQKKFKEFNAINRHSGHSTSLWVSFDFVCVLWLSWTWSLDVTGTCHLRCLCFGLQNRWDQPRRVQQHDSCGLVLKGTFYIFLFL